MKKITYICDLCGTESDVYFGVKQGSLAGDWVLVARELDESGYHFCEKCKLGLETAFRPCLIHWKG
jgi:hypothetical protein